MMSTITLLTDFGTKDEYAGVMKGVILSINPSTVIVDISHQIDPRNVVQAAYMLQAAYPYFPAGTVHLVVVDPGVGSNRDIIAVTAVGQTFLAPNNGVLTVLMEHAQPDAIVRVENSQYYLSPVSRTFHGRDIFAPVGAHLARGLKIQSLGPSLSGSQAVRLPLQKPVVSESGELMGTIIAVDRFGNLLTSIDSADLEAFRGSSLQGVLSIRIGENEIDGLSSHYGSVPLNQPLAVIGSRGLLEICVNCGRASTYFNARRGDAVKLVPRR